ncbi:trypsin-like peptidase domain-containing protein [Rubripirellula sp.]|nr:trypsin-like peptidase domain-containing protein [Rubripirellula sp.]
MNHDLPPSRSHSESNDGGDDLDEFVAQVADGNILNVKPDSDALTANGAANGAASALESWQHQSEVGQKMDLDEQSGANSLGQATERPKSSSDGSCDELCPGSSPEKISLLDVYESPNHPKLRIGHEESMGESQSDVGMHFVADGHDELVTGNRVSLQDPLRQSLFLLATMALLLLAARYFVPRIVEEIRYSWHRGELRAEYESGSEGLRNVSLDTLSRAYQMVTSTVGPSVVHIDVKQPSAVTDIKIQGQVIPFYQPQTDQGSGVIVAGNGYVLTNRHVIDGGEEIYVTLGDGRRLQAAIIGTDKQTDLAVLKVDADNLIPIAWGDSDRCRVGSPVWAVGSPFGLDQTVTFGILSGKHRMVEDSTHYQDFMQSDVAVNPGNSGGPLVDARGTLVGINTAIVGESYQGVSFAIPSNVAKQVYERLKEIGRVDRGWLGVRLSEVEDENLIGDNRLMRGAVVSGLTNENSPAALAGLKLGDHILTVDSKVVRDLPHLMRLIGGSLAGSDITLELVRQGRPLTVTVVLGARPDLFNQP